MIDAVIDATDKAQFAVDHYHLAVQAAEQVGAHAHEPGTRIEQLNLDAGVDHGFDKRRTQVRGAVVIHRDDDFRAICGGFEQRLLQALADPVFKNNEGLDQHFLARGTYALEYPGIEILAIDQQLYRVAVTPLPCRIAHKVNSTASGA